MGHRLSKRIHLLRSGALPSLNFLRLSDCLVRSLGCLFYMHHNIYFHLDLILAESCKVAVHFEDCFGGAVSPAGVYGGGGRGSPAVCTEAVPGAARPPRARYGRWTGGGGDGRGGGSPARSIQPPDGVSMARDNAGSAACRLRRYLIL